MLGQGDRSESELSRELIALLGAGGREERIVRTAVGWLRETVGVAGAAIYLRRDGVWRRRAQVGTGGFAESLGREPGVDAVAVGPGYLLTSPPRHADEIFGAAYTVLAFALELMQTRQRLEQETFQAKYRGVELEVLYDVGLAIAGTLDLGELGEEILLRAVSLIDARRGALYLLQDGELRLHTTIGGEARSQLPVAAEGLDKVCSDPTAARALEPLPGAEHLLALPIAFDDRVKGLLVAGDKESRSGVGAFLPGDRRTLGLFANQAAIALENAHLHRQALEKERLESEMQMASQIQQQLLPETLPAIPGWELDGWSRPARQVGGDYFDLLHIGGRLGAVVGDVTGKGMPAALLVSTLHSALHLLWDLHGTGEELLGRLNTHLLESSAANKFVTLFLAEIDPQSGEVHYLNAGHNPAVILRRDGSLEELAATGLPLGLLSASVYGSERVRLEPGDLLCLYSDGITEASSLEDDEYGLERLGALLREVGSQPLAAVRETIEAAVGTFAKGLPQGDDQTLVLIRRAVA